MSILLLIIPFLTCFISCNKDEEETRNDLAVRIEIDLSGSLQNPAFSPDGKSIVFTNFRKGYNKSPSDLYIYNLETKELRQLVADGSSNVNLPGECWNASLHKITFSSDREPHDEIYSISETGAGGDEIRITNRQDSVGFEPTYSPDGQWIVFESHKLDEEKNGLITKFKLDGSSDYINLTPPGEDCKQPNWSPAGDKILYQKEENDRWDIWVMNTDGSGKTKVTDFEGSKTDAVFTSDGQYIIFSSDYGAEEANIYKAPVAGDHQTRLTDFEGYDGAPAISPDGNTLIFESCEGDPDKSKGTSLWMLHL
jgi:TolB protein